ncbi:Beta ketoacyl synthase [Sphingobium yanoikuyae]|uniref:Nodulation protein E n=2 Tax=Sphingobium yanoikuyae TaxID=13690 RepID=A0A084EBE2_SPHYA|nr:Beta ketoacyl synthase [Sphingobium yanoikuyae]
MIATKIAAQALDFDPEVHFDPRRSGALDRFSQFAVVAAREAVAQSGLTRGDASLRAAAAIVGIGVGGMVTLDDAFYRMYGQNIARAHPLTIPKLMCNAAASQVSMDIGTHGITYAIASACASGTHAIGVAAQLVRSGACQVALTGGAEACVTAGTLIGWEALRVLANDTCRPFSRNRSGLVLGEGAGMLVLEDWDSAVARGAPILAEILGFGANADAGDLTSPDADGAADAIRLALADGGLLPEAVGYVNAHGTGTTINDRVESTALRSVFGDALPPVSSSKAVLGHALGAAGALEAVVTICALRHQVIPPTANCDQPDEELGIDMVPDGARDASFGAALSNSFAFGGLNAVLALGRA